ncbi:MAG: ribosome recycling factor [Thermoflexales bacterium]
MVEEVRRLLKDVEREMDKSIAAMEADFQQIRTGRASPGLVEKLTVEYYGTLVPLQQLATITVPEAQVLMIKPFDPSSLKPIEKAILNSDLGLTPNNDGKVIRLQIPPLTQERRRELVKLVHKRAEEAKVALRNQRHEYLELLKALEHDKTINEDEHKRSRQELDQVTHRYVEKVDMLSARKEREIMEM